MFYTEYEFKQIEELKNEIVPIITNKAASSLSPSLIKLCETIGHRYWPSFCTKCSSGRYNLMTRLYYRLLEDEKEKNKINQEKNGKEEKSGDGKSVSKTNRKSGSKATGSKTKE